MVLRRACESVLRRPLVPPQALLQMQLQLQLTQQSLRILQVVVLLRLLMLLPALLLLLSKLPLMLLLVLAALLWRTLRGYQHDLLLLAVVAAVVGHFCCRVLSPRYGENLQRNYKCR